MADLRPQYHEEAVGANHPIKDDVINRAWNVEHAEDGTHKPKDVDSFGGLATAVATWNADGTDVTLQVTTSQTSLSANLTVNSNISLIVLKEGLIPIDAGKTLTINGPFEAGLYQVFSGAGTVYVNEYIQYPEWWGTSDATATTAAIKACIDSLNGSGHKGIIKYTQGVYVINGTIDDRLRNDIEWEGASYGTRIFLEANSDCHMITESNNRSRISINRIWLDGNKANQGGDYRGFNFTGDLYSASIRELHVMNCGGAGFYIADGTALEILKLDVTYCGESEGAVYLPEDTSALGIAITGQSSGAYSGVHLSIGSRTNIDRLHLENTTHLEFRGHGSRINAIFTNYGLGICFGDNSYSNYVGEISGTLVKRVGIFDNGHHNRVQTLEKYSKHNCLEILHPGDGNNPFLLNGTGGWTNLSHVRHPSHLANNILNLPPVAAMLVNTNTIHKDIGCVASIDYLIECFYQTVRAGNTVILSIERDDTQAEIYTSGALSSPIAQTAVGEWDKFVGVVALPAVTELDVEITAAGTASDSTFAAFTGYRLSQSFLVNGSFEAMTGGAADNWTLTGAGATQADEVVIVRFGSGHSQKITTGAAIGYLLSDVMSLEYGVDYLFIGYAKIASGSVRAYFGQNTNSPFRSASKFLGAEDANGWRPIQQIFSRSTFTGGAETKIRIEVAANSVVYLDDFAVIPLVSQGLEAARRARHEIVLDLSGAAQTEFILSADRSIYITDIYFTYVTEASSADAGIKLEIGYYDTGGSDRDYFGDYTTQINQSEYQIRRINESGAMYRHVLSAGDTVQVYSPGGKAGIGEIICTIEYCVL